MEFFYVGHQYIPLFMIYIKFKRKKFKKRVILGLCYLGDLGKFERGTALGNGLQILQN